MNNHMETNIHRSDYLCPTFTSYTDDKSAATAARVASSSHTDPSDSASEFEFDLIETGLSLDDVSHNGSNRVFPVFGSPVHRHVDGSDSSASSDDEETSYCVWKARKVKSVGSCSKRWKLLDFLKRSNSEGKGDFVFLAPKRKEIRRSNDAVTKHKASPVEEFYVRSRNSKEGQKGKTYLPYKKDLVGFFR